MKSSRHTTLAVCALLGVASAVHDYNFNDKARYSDDNIQAFINENINENNVNFSIGSESYSDKQPDQVAKKQEVASTNKQQAPKQKTQAIQAPQPSPLAPTPFLQPVAAVVTKPIVAPQPVMAPKPAVPVAAPKQEVKQEEKQVSPNRKTAQEAWKNSLPQPPSALSESELTAENLARKDNFDTEMSNSFSDYEYVQTSNVQDRFSFFINNIQGPDDLIQLGLGTGKKKGWHGRRITDMDGDGVEDVEKFSHDTLDEFYEPLVFGVAEDINNTHHGNLPGHKQLWFTLSESEPTGHWLDIVQQDWQIK